MPVKVVDASALGALVFGEPGAEIVAKQLSRSTLAAPQLLWFESPDLRQSRRLGYVNRSKRYLEKIL